MIRILVFLSLFALAVSGQNGGISMNGILQPSAEDFAEAGNQGYEVFKLAPRGMFDYVRNELSLRGGGAYYSFVKKSHSYNETPQIELQQNNLSVGFAGANYGFIADLGIIPLADVSREKKFTGFLLNYQSKKIEAEAREEYQKGGKGFEIEKIKYSKNVAANVGHTYLLRAISYDEADALVAFTIHRKNDDGSLTIFWKILENFEKPRLIKESEGFLRVNENSNSENRAAKIQEALNKKGFTQITVAEEKNLITLRGKIPKGKFAEVVQSAMEANEGKPVRSELTEF